MEVIHIGKNMQKYRSLVGHGLFKKETINNNQPFYHR